MVRKVLTVTIPATTQRTDPKTGDVTEMNTGKRDTGKAFYITELPCAQAEKWAIRALLAVAAHVDIPEDIVAEGMAGIARIGLPALAKLQFSDAEALLDEMFDTIEIIPDPSKPQVRRALVDDDIEEIATRVRLRGEWLKLHVDFSPPVAP